MVRTSLEGQGSIEQPERNRAMGMPNWHSGNEQIIDFLRVYGLQIRGGKRAMPIRWYFMPCHHDLDQLIMLSRRLHLMHGMVIDDR